MSEQTAEQTAEATEASEQASTEATASQSETQGAPEDWQERFEAQKKINQDLEAKLKKSARGDGHARAKELETQLAELQAKIEGREAEFKAEQERRATEKAALDKANQRILKAEIRAAAAGKIAPDMVDALPGLLDLSSFEVGDDGEVDASAITEAISDLITRRPSLAVQDGKRFQGDPDAGARKEARPAQLTQSDLDRMTPEQISEARKKGQLDDLLGIKR